MGLYLQGNTWWTRFELAGKRYNRSTGTSDRGEAEWFEKHLRATLRGEPSPEPEGKPERGTSMLLSSALARIKQEEWQFLRAGDSQIARINWIIEEMGNPRLHEIDDPFLENLKRRLRERGRDTATVNRYMAHLRKILRTAKLAWRVQIELPLFRMGKESSGRDRIVTHEEEAQMLQVLRASIDGLDKRFKFKGNIADLFEVLVETGMRLGEPLAMTWDHVDLKNKLINLTKDITKSSKPRSIPMSDRVYQILTRRHRQGSPTPFPFTKDVAEKAFRYAKRQCGITDPEFCWHSLRHTFASRLLNQGVDIYTVGKILGHSSVTVTERYSHMSVNRLRDAVNTLNGGE